MKAISKAKKAALHAKFSTQDERDCYLVNEDGEYLANVQGDEELVWFFTTDKKLAFVCVVCEAKEYEYLVCMGTLTIIIK